MMTLHRSRRGLAPGLVLAVLPLAGGNVLAATGGTTAAPGTSLTVPTPPCGGPGYYGYFGGPFGSGFGGEPVIAAAATYLGLSETDLVTQRQAGKTLADVAQSQGKMVSALESAMVAMIQSNLDASTALSADRKAAILASAKVAIDSLVTSGGPYGFGGGPMMGALRLGLPVRAVGRGVWLRARRDDGLGLVATRPVVRGARPLLSRRV